MNRNEPALLRKALDTIAEACGAPAGSHPDDVIRVVRDMRSDPQRHHERRERALYVASRLVDSLDDLVRDSSDPGSEAMGALWEGKEFIRCGGAHRQPLPANIDPDRLQDEIEEALEEDEDDDYPPTYEEQASQVVAVVLKHVRRGA